MIEQEFIELPEAIIGIALHYDGACAGIFIADDTAIDNVLFFEDLEEDDCSDFEREIEGIGLSYYEISRSVGEVTTSVLCPDGYLLYAKCQVMDEAKFNIFLRKQNEN